jgi:hypothetical protein
MAADGYIGYVRYSGALVEDGLLDARKTAQALIGFDTAVRFFVGFQDPRLREVNYELPVRIRKGSWEALIPNRIDAAIFTSLSVVGMVYLSTAAKKLATNDFKDMTTREVFRKALEGIQWMIRLGKHLGDAAIRTFKRVKFRKANQEVGIPNAEGVYLYIPKGFYDMYVAARPDLLVQLASLVERERKLSIGVYRGSRKEEEVLTIDSKYVFAPERDDPAEVLFPELRHGETVVLDGALTRGNRETNSVGFKYHDHILNCVPSEGSIVRYKKFLFGPARIYGTVSRLDDFGRIGANRPTIEISRIEVLKRKESQTVEMFPDEEDDGEDGVSG